ncbi:DUF881 domain-containing protein [Nocardioides sp. 1609]|uniref:DUF881 domain-containing protein n=1 Tax=Nocardioides sp. 1609 TaxID=2508327 RepID=UPI001FD6DC68|nr:DUF881 domain-containing protein [Nocardioides sp. 1609]
MDDDQPTLQPGEQTGEQTGDGSDVPAPRLTGRARLGRALLRPSQTQLIVAVLLALVGFAAVTQIRTTEQDSTYAGLREQDLIDVLNGLAGTTQRTRAEIDRLTSDREDLQSESTQRQAALDRARDEVDNLQVLAGLVPVTGPGIRATITEETGSISVSSMLDVIQELRSVGAEAIQINGEVRVIAQTSFEEGVGGIEVDGTLLEAPYVVDAIGDASTLAGSISFALGPRAEVRKDGGEIEVEELDSLDIDAVREPEQPEYAQPD